MGVVQGDFGDHGHGAGLDQDQKIGSGEMDLVDVRDPVFNASGKAGA